MSAKNIIDDSSKLWAPPPKMSVTQWADQFRVLSSESGAAAGQWKTLAYQREIFDAFSDPTVHTLVVMSATQMVKTSLLENCLGYLIDRDPGPTLLIVPRDSDAEKFSKIRLAPMIRDTPCLSGKVADSKAKKSGNTLDYKSFAGGHLTIAAAGSPGNLAALPIRYLLMDECDKYPASAGSEGDPVSLALKRTATFWNRKIVLACSPTIDGESRIAKAYEESDMREFYAPCQACAGLQVLAWSQVKWNNGLATKEQCAASAHYECSHCKAPWTDIERWRAVDEGQWASSAAFAGTAGFRISELASPWKTLADIVLDFLNKKDDPRQLQTFVNTSLCEVWKQQGEVPVWEKLFARREEYPIGVVPNGGLMLVAAVDVQRDRLEFELLAYGRRRESWSITYSVLPGDPNDISHSGPWAQLAQLLAFDWPHQNGGTMAIWACAIDTGELPAPVYQFAMQHPRPIWSPAGTRIVSSRTVVPVKGNEDPLKLISAVSETDAAQRRRGIRIWSVGTHYAKQEFFDLLRREPSGDGTFPAGFVHLPSYSREYFQGLCSESRVVRSTGKVEWLRLSGVRNEPLDLRVYARAAAELCGVSHFSESTWLELERRAGQGTGEAHHLAPATPPPQSGQPRRFKTFAKFRV